MVPTAWRETVIGSPMPDQPRKKPQNFEDLIVFQKAMDLADRVHDAADLWPRSERYGLISQIKRASISVFSNIAEGQGRNKRGEFVYFLGIAYGSLMEVRAQLLFAHKRHYMADAQRENLLELATVVAKLLNALIRSLGGSDSK